jgi:hypothetical protein
MGAPYNVGQPVKLIVTDFSGQNPWSNPTAFTIYDEAENQLTLNPADYLILVSASVSYIDANLEGPGATSIFVMSGNSGISAANNPHVLLAFSTGSGEWKCGGEGLFLPLGQVPYVISTIGAAGSSSAVIIEGRLVRNPFSRQGYQNPLLQ